MTDIPHHSLSNTLILALAQCQEQLRTIKDQSNRISQLQQENERLRKELLVATKHGAVRDVLDGSGQTQDLFQKNVEAQAEIRMLKKKLKSFKEKTPERVKLPISSPLSNPATPAPCSPRQAPAKRGFQEISDTLWTGSTGRNLIEADENPEITGNMDSSFSSPPSKKAKVGIHEVGNVSKEFATNTIRSDTSISARSEAATVAKRKAAIPLVAEDGEEEIPMEGESRVQQRIVSRNDSVHHRLTGLLADTVTVRSPLTRPTLRSPHPTIPPSNSTHIRLTHGSHTHRDVTDERSKSRKHRKQAELDAGSGAEMTDIGPNAPQVRSSGVYRHLQTSSPDQTAATSKKSAKPLRSLPLDNLTASSFKPNPRWLTSHNMSYDDFLDNRHYERMRTLATTLPHLPSESIGNDLVDHELLLEFLGSGSEARIAALTPVARQNLITEAKTKRVAQYFRFAKQRPGLDLEDGPPGFWVTDMPGTQEAEENRQVAQQREREEVKQRYDDAMTGQGRWVFADE